MNYLGETSNDPQLRETRVSLPTAQAQLKYTIGQIGQGIKNGSHYVPLIKHAQALASRAKPKDYLGQVKEVYDDFVKRWRYVRDPVALETVHTSGRSIYGQILGFDNTDPTQHGKGDCDDSSIYGGAALRAIGFPIRISTIAPLSGSPALFSHVFVQAKLPGVGWYTFDPVGYPKHGPGWTPPYSRIAHWDLDGNLLSFNGRFPKTFHRDFSGVEDQQMQGIQITKSDLLDYGLGAYSGDSTSPLNWNEYGLLEFGAYAGQMGIIDGDDTGLLMDFDGDDIVDDLHPDYRGLGLVRNKMLEVAPVDYELIRRYGAPRLGSVALGDDGDVYQYVKDPELGGFFKKIFSKVGGAIKKGVRWVGSKAKQLISKLPGGKYLVKLYDKVYKTSMRLVKPLMRIVGKYAKPLSKIAAFIPGYGPVIAGALHTAGKITDVLKKTGVKLDKKGKPQFKSGKQAKRFKKELKKQAEKMKRKKRKKKEEKKRGKKQDWKKQYKAKLLKKLQREQARKTGRPVAPEQPKSGRLLKAGTPEHKQYLRGLGIDPNLLGN